MKAGDIVEHLGRPELGAGKIISFQSHLGTILVKFEGLEARTYHSPLVLKKKMKKDYGRTE